ncbi:GNAT family N-acetyltransferase [Thomasclavelia ramosa]
MSTDGKAVGCIAYCHHRNQCYEMKRLYVKPDFRNQ